MNINSEQFVDPNYLQELDKQVAEIVEFNQIKEAFDLLGIVDRAYQKNSALISDNKELREFYKQKILYLKFIALPLLDNNKVAELLRNNYTFQYKIADYSFKDQFAKKIKNVIFLDDRDNFKKEIAKVLLNNDGKIADIKISDWIREYGGEVGLDKAENIKRIQYLVKLKSDNRLGKGDYRKLEDLFNLYEYLKISALSDEGFEEAYQLVKDGKIYTFRKGKLELVGDADVSETEKVEVENTAQESLTSSQEEPKPKPEPVNNDEVDLSLPVVDPDQMNPILKSKLNSLADLKKSLSNYEANSLEHKGLSQEIKRLEIEINELKK